MSEKKHSNLRRNIIILGSQDLSTHHVISKGFNFEMYKKSPDFLVYLKGNQRLRIFKVIIMDYGFFKFACCGNTNSLKKDFLNNLNFDYLVLYYMKLRIKAIERRSE